MRIHFQFMFLGLQLRGSRGFQKSSATCSDHLFVHRDTPEDNPNIKFEFTPENQKVIELQQSQFVYEIKRFSLVIAACGSNFGHLPRRS